jgi:hypothetical protein
MPPARESCFNGPIGMKKSAAPPLPLLSCVSEEMITCSPCRFNA